MFVSITILGLTAESLKLVEGLKEIDGFGLDFRVQAIQVLRLADYPELVTYRFTEIVGRELEEWSPVLKDSTYEVDHLMVRVSDDLPWLIGSDGHDTIVIAERPAEWDDVINELESRDYWIIDLKETGVERSVREIQVKLNARRSANSEEVSLGEHQV